MGSHKKKREPSTSSETSSEDESARKSKKRSHSEKKKRVKKRKHESSTSSDTSTSSSSESSSSSDSEERKKQLKKKKKLQKNSKNEKIDTSSDIPLNLMTKSKTMAPMTKEEWEKKQNVVRKVYDESTGRHRLIKGDGEVIEEIVSRERHKTINQQATRGDGDFFQGQMSRQLKK